MKISKKEYRDKQNQATGFLMNGAIWTIYFGVKAIGLVNDYNDGVELEEIDSIFVPIWFLLGIPISIWRWRKAERELKILEIDDLLNETKINKKTYQRKSNQSIGSLIMGIVGLGFIASQVVAILGSDHEIERNIWLFLSLGILFSITGFWQWRSKEKELKDLDVSDT